MSLWSKFRALVAKKGLEADMAAEMQHHLELQAERNRAAGMTAEEARFAAQRQFGNVGCIQESARDVRQWRWLADFVQDWRHDWRSLAHERSFTVGCVLVFALGIGANATIFSALNGVVMRPLPVTEPERVMRVWETNPARRVRSFSVPYLDYRDWVQRSDSWEFLAATDARSLGFIAGGEPEQVQAQLATASLLPLFNLRVARGRGFNPEDDQPGRGRVAILSDGFWRRRFVGDGNVLNREVTVDGQAYTVIGVLAAGSSVFPETDIFVPAQPFASPDRDDREFEVYGRLKAGVTPAQADAEMVGIARQLEREYPADNSGWSVRLEPLFETVVGSGVRQGLLLVLAAGGLLLAITCANLAGLLLVRATNRTRELAVRAALGGGRGRLIRQLTTEAFLLASLGGLFGGLLAWWGTGLLASLNAAGLPRANEIQLDGRVLAFTVGATLLTGLFAGLVPALSASRVDILSGLKSSGPAAGRRRSRLRAVLIVGQLALSIVLLAAAGLLVQTFRHLQRTDLGFRPEQVLTARLAPRQDARVVVETLVERIKALPGVIAVGAANSAPMARYNTSNNVFPVGPASIPVTESIQCEWRMVTADYFKALQIPVLRGRAFVPADNGQQGRVVVVNQSLARALWGDEDPLGKQINPGGGTTYSTVIGVVGDFRSRSPATPPAPSYFISAHRSVWGTMTLAVRTSGDALALVPMIRTEMRAVDPTLALFEIELLEESVGRRLASQQASATILALFAALAVALAATGIYAVMAQSTLQRTREVGIRLALGGQPFGVMRALLREGVMLIVAGAAAGLPLALAATQLLRGQLSGVMPGDPVTLFGALLLLSAAALFACWLPARRIVKVDPMVALRAE